MKNKPIPPPLRTVKEDCGSYGVILLAVIAFNVVLLFLR